MDISSHNVYWMELNRNMNDIFPRRFLMKSREELLREWSPSFDEPIKYDNGIDYQPIEPTSGADGLSVVEFKK